MPTQQRLSTVQRDAPSVARALELFALRGPPATEPTPEAPRHRTLPALDAPVQAPRTTARSERPADALPIDDGPPEAPPIGEPSGPTAPSAQPAQAAAAPEDGLVELTGKLQRLIFPREAPDPDSDAFRVYLVKVGKAEEKVSTNFPLKAGPGDRITARGTWYDYKKERRFKATIIVTDLPRDGQGIVLWMKNLPGIGQASAAKIVRHWGERAQEAMASVEMIVAAGIPRRKAELVSEAWVADTAQKDTVVFLGGLELGPANITRIMRAFGQRSRDVVERTPWRLAEVIEGIGFATADRIALRFGHSTHSPDRIRAALRAALREAVLLKGHCGLPPAEMVTIAARMIGLDESLMLPHVDAALDGTGCLLDPVSGLAASKSINEAEQRLSEALLGLLDAPSIAEADAARAIASAEEELGVRLDPSQRIAALTAVSNNVSIITGGPGTGKSTTMRVVLRALKNLGRDVVAAAPTGRAAKRLWEVTGVEASTIHRLLSYEDGDFSFGPGKPFQENWFVVDESSMMDVQLCDSFLRAIKSGSGVTFVGDVDQLPSVGPGQILRDLIASGALPTAVLEHVHRQEGDSGIIEAARRINAGKYPVQEGERLNGFGISVKTEASQIVAQIVHYVTKVLPARGKDPLADIQVLAAQRKGDVGVAELNRAIKQALNPPRGAGHTVSMRDLDWSVGDRVMQNRNNYAKKVYNGEIGTIVAVGRRPLNSGGDEDFFKVNFGQVEATYGRRDVEEIEQAYATTVHKSQGCEFPWVIIACPSSHVHMLDRNLLYTAVTRAKEGCMIVGDPEAIRRAVAAKGKTLRHTGLALRLRLAGPAPSGPRR